MNDCIFCKIAAGEIPSRKAYEDDEVLAFFDISPLAPVHILVIPKKHLSSLNEVTENEDALMAKIMRVVAQVAKENGIDQSGYRVITNIGKHGAQSVMHLHFHVIGGRKLGVDLG